jgi:hypothetical protein
MERAENTARMLDVNYQTALLPQSAERAEQGWLRPAVDQRADRAYAARHGDRYARGVLDFMVRDELQPLVHPVLPARRARERPRRARHADHRGVGDAEPDLAGVQPHAQARAPSSATRAVLRVGQVPLAPLARRDGGHHAAGRGAALPAHRHLPGACRQHRASAGREVPCRASEFFGLAPGQGARARGGLLPLERDPAFVSGFEVYRKVYRNVISPEKVAELLILRRTCRARWPPA